VRALVFAWLALLTACATLPRPAAPLTGDSFELAGRFAARQGEEAASGRLQWRHTASDDDLLLTSPIGQGIARVTRRDGRYLLETADGRRIDAEDPDVLVEEVLGWRFPVASLPSWLRARPIPGRPAQVERADTGEVSSISQDGWRVEYLAYGSPNRLPQRIRLARGDLEVRLHVDTWTTPD
jgi:outer membrane lipoprotein LolB